MSTGQVQRRRRPSVPIIFPDWLVVRPLSAHLIKMIARYGNGVFADVGCGSGPFSEIARQIGARYIGIDLAPGVGVDVVASVTALPFDTASIDTVLCSQVLEHVPALNAALLELARVLRPGGYLLISVPQYSPEHEVPNDYRRFTVFGLEHDLGIVGLDVIEVHRQGGAFSVAGLAINYAICERILGPRSNHIVWYAKATFAVPLFTSINAFATLLDRLIPSRNDCVNLLIVAKRQ